MGFGQKRRKSLAFFANITVGKKIRMASAKCSFLVAITVLFCSAIAANAQEKKSNPFLDAGIPPTNREWRGSDYIQTLTILSTGKIAPPVFSEKAGAALLHRITSVENLSFYKNRAIPVQARLSDWSSLQKGANSLMYLYYETSIEKKQALNAEISNLLAFMLHVSAQGADLVEESLPTVPKDDKYTTRMEGLRTMNAGLTKLFFVAEIALTYDGYSSTDRSAILDAMASTLPRIKKVFTDGARTELSNKLEADRKSFSRVEDNQKITKMLRDLAVSA
jgi:hypothetical protein